MSKDPAFLFYSADFLVGVMDLTDEETGQYIKLICLQHQKGRLTKKAIKIAFPNISPDVLAKFEIDENGLYYNPRVEEEVIKRENFVRARQENGAKGGRPKKPTQNLNETDRLSLAKPIGKPTQNLTENGIVNEDIDNIGISNIIDDDIDNEFIPPTYEQVEEYAIKRDRLDLAKTFYDYYTEGNWRDKDGNEVTAWKQKFVAWESRNPKKDEDKGSFDTDDFFQTALKRSYGK